MSQDTNTSQSESDTAESIDMQDDLENVGGDFKPTELDDSKMIRRNSVDHYTSPEAGPRESISNGVTSIRDAREKGYLDADEGEIIVRLIEEEQNKWRLEIQDTGIGLSMDRIEMIRRMGVSSSASNSENTGKFGIGWFANYKITSASGRFFSHSVSRETGDETVVIWTLNGRKILSDQVPDLRGKDYGTVLSMYPKEDLSVDDLEKYITRHAKSAREKVTVIKEPYTGSVSETVYEPIDIIEEYSGEFGYTIENEYVSVVTSPEVPENMFYMLDNSMDVQQSVSSIPWNIAIRVKTEEHTIFESEDPEKIGLQVLPTDQYELMSDSNQESYIPERDIADTDVLTPAPTGSRDSLSRLEQFMSWVRSQIKESVTSDIQPMLDKSIPEDLTKSEMNYLWKVISTKRRSRDIRVALNSISQSLSHSSDTRDDLLDIIGYEVNVHDSTVHLDIAKQHKYGTTRYCAVELTNFAEQRNAEIFMGVNINETKAKVAKSHAEDVIFVKVSESSDYDKYTPLGWNKLKDIKKSTLSEYNLTESEVSNFEEEMGKSESDDTPSKLTVRYGVDRYNNIAKATLPELKSDVGSGEKVGSKYTAERLVLFPTSGDENVSDHFDLGGYKTAVARCSDSQAEELCSANENILTFEEYFEQSKSAMVQSIDGEVSGEDLLALDATHSKIVMEIVPEGVTERVAISDYTKQELYNINREMGRYTYRTYLDREDVTVLWSSVENERDIRPILRHLRDTKDIQLSLSWSDQIIYPDRKLPDWSDTNLSSYCPITYTALLLLTKKPQTDDVKSIQNFFDRTNFNTVDDSYIVIEKLMDTL